MPHLGILQNEGSDSDLEWGLQFCISKKLTGDADTVDPWTTLRSMYSIISYNLRNHPYWVGMIIPKVESGSWEKLSNLPKFRALNKR